jgi:hypothetical protein
LNRELIAAPPQALVKVNSNILTGFGSTGSGRPGKGGGVNDRHHPLTGVAITGHPPPPKHPSPQPHAPQGAPQHPANEEVSAV